jgi:hypothetical protein
LRSSRALNLCDPPLKLILMRPGQLNLNDLELAILRRIALGHQFLVPLIPTLHVLSREFTGVGSYTNFRHPDDSTGTSDGRVGLDVRIAVPRVRNGLGSILFLKHELPLCLEIYAYGEDLWDGCYDGFAFVPAA